MLQSLVADKMRRERLSARDAARQIGVSHTTIIRMLDGDIPNIENLVAVSKWLGVSLSNALGVASKTNDSVATRVAMIIEAEPRLGNLFSSIVQDFNDGKLGMEDIEDILAYAAFRLSKKGSSDAQSEDVLSQRDRGGDKAKH